MKKYFCLSLLILAAATFKAQSFKKGDLIMSLGYGMPNIAAWSEKMNFEGPNPYYFRSYNNVSYSINTGVISARAEYAVSNMFSLGLSAGFWQMDIDHSYTYNNFSMATPISSFEKYRYHLSSASIAARVNYHFWKNKVIDVYTGIGIGVTNHGYSYRYLSQSREPAGPRGFMHGIGPCVAASFGFKYYFNSGIGLSFELGYDTGAMCLGGIAFRLRNKKNGDLK